MLASGWPPRSCLACAMARLEGNTMKRPLLYSTIVALTNAWILLPLLCMPWQSEAKSVSLGEDLFPNERNAGQRFVESVVNGGKCQVRRNGQWENPRVIEGRDVQQGAVAVSAEGFETNRVVAIYAGDDVQEIVFKFGKTKWHANWLVSNPRLEIRRATRPDWLEWRVKLIGIAALCVPVFWGVLVVLCRRKGAPGGDVDDGYTGKHVAWVTNKGTKMVNEDHAWVDDWVLPDGVRVVVACVADGVSGGRNGAQVSAMAVRAVKEAFGSATSDVFSNVETFGKWTASWAELLQAEVLDQYPRGYSTLSVFATLGNVWAILHVGDSVVFWIPDDGSGIRRLTSSHTLADEMIRNGETEEVAMQYEKTLVRAIGKTQKAGSGLMDSILLEPMGAGWIVVGSDGVFDNLTGIELGAIAESSRNAKGLVRQMLHVALENGRTNVKEGEEYYQDNATVAAIRID